MSIAKEAVFFRDTLFIKDETRPVRSGGLRWWAG